MIIYTKAATADLPGILRLQQANLPRVLDADEIKSQGFVTLVHTEPLLQRMQQIEAHVIAKDQDEVIAYVLAMTVQSRADIPELESLFEQFEQVSYQGKVISQYHYLVVGQACVAKAYRGQGVFGQSYQHYRDSYGEQYDFAITCIAAANTRSLRAHQKVGFQLLHQYKNGDQQDWWIVLWDWRNPVE